MNLRAWFFPKQSRSFTGQRWLSIALRSLHLIGIAGVGAAFLFDVSQEQWLPYMTLTVASGIAMIILETWNNGIWLVQVRGLFTLIKLLILSMSFYIGLHPYILFSVIIISGVMSHAPAWLRHRRIYG